LTTEVNRFDIVVETTSHEFKRVSSLNPYLMALHCFFHMPLRGFIWELNMSTDLLRLVVRRLAMCPQLLLLLLQQVLLLLRMRCL
jgi:hypothetical protein